MAGGTRTRRPRHGGQQTPGNRKGRSQPTSAPRPRPSPPVAETAPGGSGKASAVTLPTPRIVGIGMSAGGFEACSELLTALPARPGFAIVIVQHLAPDHTSALSGLLDTRSTLRVVEARDGMTDRAGPRVRDPAERAHRARGRARARAAAHARDRGQPLPVDFFLASLAVLDRRPGDRGHPLRHGHRRRRGAPRREGAGRDRARAAPGDRALRRHAAGRDRHRPRRRRAPAGCARGQARRGRGQPYSADPPSPSFGDLQIRRGAVRAARRPAARGERRRRLQPLQAADDQAADPAADGPQPGEPTSTATSSFCGSARTRPAASTRTSSSTSRGSSASPSRSTRSRREVLPKLLLGARGDASRADVGRRLRDRRGGLLARDHGLRAGRARRVRSCSVQIFGTDVSETAIEVARQGFYPATIAEDVSPERLRRFFTRVDGGYRVSKTIRDRCVFARQDLTRDPPFSKLDLILLPQRADLHGRDPAAEAAADLPLRAAAERLPRARTAPRPMGTADRALHARRQEAQDLPQAAVGAAPSPCRPRDTTCPGGRCWRAPSPSRAARCASCRPRRTGSCSTGTARPASW